MKLIAFTGHSSAEALKKAMQICGDEALVVNTKEIRRKTFNTPALWEVVVAVEEEVAKKAEKVLVAQKATVPASPAEESEDMDAISDNAKSRTNSIKNRIDSLMQKGVNPYAKNNNIEDVSSKLQETVRQIKQITEATQKTGSFPAPVKQAVKKEPEPPRDSRELKLIKGEIDKLNDKLKLIQHMFWDEKGPKKEGLVIPQEFSEIYSIAKNSGMNKDHLNTIMRLTLEHMPVRMRENSMLIKRYFKELLRRMIYSRQELEPKDARKIIMLVGPTGVGKTTTLAKLAARYAYQMQKRYQVGVITLDTYRIGAVDQAMQYAKMMKLSINTVLDPPEFVSAINQLKHCDYILVDTVGSSQYDKEKIDSLKEYLNRDETTQIDVNLVISANTKYDDLIEIYKNFSILNIDTVIVTKIDETRGYGNIFSLMYETKKPLSYFSTGQNVPDDLMVANGEYLVDCLIDGFKKVKK